MIAPAMAPERGSWLGSTREMSTAGSPRGAGSNAGSLRRVAVVRAFRNDQLRAMTERAAGLENLVGADLDALMAAEDA
jgi:hypothetical protein